MPSRLCFFSQISWHVSTFQTCAANFSKPITDTDTMFPLKVAQVPGLHFRWKKISKKIGFMVFFKKTFWKNAIFECFLCLIPYFSEPGPNTGSMVSCNLQAFHRLHFRLKLASKFFSDLVFWAKKWMKKMSEIFFSFVALFSQNWRKIQKPFSLKINSKDVS